MPTKINNAMVLAAGLGTRMRPLTDTTPKPMIPVHDKPLIDYTLDMLKTAGVEKAIVNTHYLADQIESHVSLRSAPKVILSQETDAPLETGGALIKAAKHFENNPIFCTNTDAIIDGGSIHPCDKLQVAWEDAKMDALLLLAPLDRVSGYNGKGDFALLPNGQLTWPAEAPGKSLYVFTGLQIIHPRLFADEPLRTVSTRHFWEKAMAKKRFFGIIHDGDWLHVGDPAGLKAAEAYFSMERE